MCGRRQWPQRFPIDRCRERLAAIATRKLLTEFGWNADVSLTTRRARAITLTWPPLAMSVNTMNRSLHLLINVSLAAATGCLSAYALLYMSAPATRGAGSTPTIALVATGGAPTSPAAPPVGVAMPYSDGAERPTVIVSYRDAVARAAP